MSFIDTVRRRLTTVLVGRDSVRALKRRGLIVGKNFCMETDVIIDYSHLWHIEIGEDVTLAPRVHVLAHDASTKRHLGYTRIGKVKLGNRVFVGAGSVILPGVTIGDNVIIGAGSVVSCDIPNNQVAAGNPARRICSIEDFPERKRGEMEICPLFGEEYTTRRNITPDMKGEMNTRMKDGIGYVV